MSSGSSGLTRSFVCGNKFKGKKDGLGAILKSDDETSFSVEFVNLDHNADTFWHRSFFGHQIADAKLRDALHVCLVARVLRGNNPLYIKKT